ncbi:sugar phosphate isomerase/epimerase [Streptomyces sp. 110]|uniref:Sugar phosphate isomerase/epimerase n=1 Tax=Streptomyces endocoffeicus TaxID=2898945 RepID=A0ABS1PL23_9ACTN|nr:sugar phosphate isomerase/epimerase [Streptomyces endocoffeicus]MBL1112979.1 sugar phosphate isomerase/epimerase [Streptomyces endocoffeicus]
MTHDQLALGAMTFRGRDFEASLDAAQRSGFRAIGISVAQCVACLERGIPPEAMAEALRERDLRVAELELIRLGERGMAGHLNALVLDLIGILRPDRVHVAAFSGTVEEVKREFATLCEQITATDVAFEFMPYSIVRDVATAVDLVRTAASPRAKLVLDVVHFFRSGADVAELTPDLLALTAGLQLSDLVPRPGVDLAYESRHLRTFPGDGVLPLADFLRAVLTATGGTPPPVTIEPVSDALETLPVAWVAERAMQSTARLLTEAGRPR